MATAQERAHVATFDTWDEGVRRQHLRYNPAHQGREQGNATANANLPKLHRAQHGMSVDEAVAKGLVEMVADGVETAFDGYLLPRLRVGSYEWSTTYKRPPEGRFLVGVTNDSGKAQVVLDFDRDSAISFAAHLLKNAESVK